MTMVSGVMKMMTLFSVAMPKLVGRKSNMSNEIGLPSQGNIKHTEYIDHGTYIEKITVVYHEDGGKDVYIDKIPKSQ